MWRSLFVAIGIMAIIFGIECLLIDSAELYSRTKTTAVRFFDPTGRPASASSTWTPQEWMPWLVLGAGAVLVIYAFTLPQRFRSMRSES